MSAKTQKLGAEHAPQPVNLIEGMDSTHELTQDTIQMIANMVHNQLVYVHPRLGFLLAVLDDASEFGKGQVEVRSNMMGLRIANVAETIVQKISADSYPAELPPDNRKDFIPEQLLDAAKTLALEAEYATEGGTSAADMDKLVAERACLILAQHAAKLHRFSKFVNWNGVVSIRTVPGLTDRYMDRLKEVKQDQLETRLPDQQRVWPDGPPESPLV